ncbi:TPR repeat-containing response regulator [Catenovulum agarivorans DS-2]|uniref:TPR repeat-containing response regulator n=2 Tax=Catenovulum agarivorans TaxID=1172192 RepID=W7QNG4_9ALTE|nr:TPR repeat-containing response regulator [Catenovulum agarivorans DS-2]
MVTNGEAAISAAKNHEFDFILVDYNLGGHRKNGRQVIEEIKTKKLVPPHCISIMVTGENHRPMVLGAIELQPDDYVMKPFSQNVLKHRLDKALHKRTNLLPIYQAMHEENFEQAMNECTRLISENNRYRNFCNNLLAELLCKQKQYEQAEYLLTKLLKVKPYTWGQIQLARTYHHQGKHQQAIVIATEVMKQAPMIIDSYDLMAEAFHASGDLTHSLEMAIRAAELSPYSVERQYRLCQIAQSSDMHDIAKDACKAILEMTRKSVQQDSVHLLNYIRATINAAEHSEEKSEQNKLKQEAVIALQRAKQDELIGNINNYSVFETLCNARIEAMDKHLIAAKKQLFKVMSAHAQDEEATDDPYAYEKLSLLYTMGEYELAEHVADECKDERVNKNPFIKNTISHLKQENKKRQRGFKQLNQAGIDAYKKQDYILAFHQFDSALKFAPMHTGGTLNLILAIIKLIETSEKQPEDLLKRIKAAFQALDGIELPSKQFERYKELEKQYHSLMEKLNPPQKKWR